MGQTEHERSEPRNDRAGVLRPSAETLAPRQTLSAGHPLAELQRQAGNQAVTRLLTVQRHSLHPEEEAGE